MSRIDELYCDPNEDLDDKEAGYDPLLDEPPEPMMDRRADFIYDPLRDRIGTFE